VLPGFVHSSRRAAAAPIRPPRCSGETHPSENGCGGRCRGPSEHPHEEPNPAAVPDHHC
jgi:hypothetical protein